MTLDKILSISGKPGLYELAAKTRNGFIAKSLIDGKKLPVNIQNNVSMLSEIAIYTYTEEIPLNVVFNEINKKTEGQKAIDHKSSKAQLEEFLREVLPEYDEDRVYTSDIKKLIQWYNILVDQNFDFQAEVDEKEEESEPKSTEAKTTSKA